MGSKSGNNRSDILTTINNYFKEYQMALQINLPNTQFGVPAPQAYARITNFYGTKDNLQVQVAIHFNQAAREQNLSTVLEHAHYINIADLKGDLLPAIYGVLKSMSQYQGSIDV
jgi:hypothetical protein